MMKDIQIKKAGKKGKGVFALRDFGKGEFIFRGQRGVLIKKSELTNLSKEDLKHLNEVDEDTLELQGPPEMYLNHSCDPNTMAKGFSYFAWKIVKEGEELTVDYRINGNFTNKWKCFCGAKNCKGWVISNFFSLPADKQKLYIPYAPKFIQRKYMNR